MSDSHFTTEKRGNRNSAENKTLENDPINIKEIVFPRFQIKLGILFSTKAWDNSQSETIKCFQ